MTDLYRSVRKAIGRSTSLDEMGDLSKAIWAANADGQLPDEEAQQLAVELQKARRRAVGVGEKRRSPSRRLPGPAERSVGEPQATRSSSRQHRARLLNWRRTWEGDRALRGRAAIQVLSIIADHVNGDPKHRFYGCAWISMACHRH